MNADNQRQNARNTATGERSVMRRTAARDARLATSQPPAPGTGVGSLLAAILLIALPFAFVAWLLVHGREDADVAAALTAAIVVVTALTRKGSNTHAGVRAMVLAVVAVTSAMFAFKDVADGVTHNVLDRTTVDASARDLRVGGQADVTVRTPWPRRHLGIVFALAPAGQPGQPGQQQCGQPDQNRLSVSLGTPGNTRLIAADLRPGRELRLDLATKPTDIHLVVTLVNNQDNTCQVDLSVTRAAVYA